jgi:hypothetical protein
MTVLVHGSWVVCRNVSLQAVVATRNTGEFRHAQTFNPWSEERSGETLPGG